MKTRLRAAIRFLSCWCLLVASLALDSSLRAQLVPKGIGGIGKTMAGQRPEGAWLGTAREKLEGGKVLEYPLEMAFTGADDALQLAVNATAKLPTEDGRTLTVAIRAQYKGTFRSGKLSMRSDSIDVRIVETGEQVPSQPQQVEGTLTAGELRGRVGSEEDGWTDFTAKPTAGGVVAPTPFAGRWSGTSREKGPDGRELSYPISVVFTGGVQDLRAEVAADLQYPTGNGGTTPVEYRATFRGQVRNGELDLRSEKVEIRLVQQQRTEAGGQQQFNGRLDGGVLKATIGGAGADSSRLELRPDTAVKGTGTEVASQETVRDTGRSEAANGDTAYATLVLERREIKDPGLGGVTSHTISVPNGWQWTGGPQWTGNPDHIVDFVGELRGPDSESLHFVGDRQFTYSRTQSQLGITDDTKGQTRPDGSIARHPPQKPGEVAAEVLVPLLRPQASDVQVVEAERLPRLEEALRTLMKPQLDMMEALSAQSRQMSNNNVQAESNTWLVVERSRVRYREQGIEWEEEMQFSLIGMHSSLSSDLMRTDNGVWTLSQVRTARAKVGTLTSRLGALWLCAGTLAESPRWSAAVNDIRLEIAKAKTQSMRANLDEIIRRGEAAARSRAEVSDLQMQSWRSQQDSLDRVHQARCDTLAERHDFRSADGNLHTVTNHYDRAFKDHRGCLILTNDPNYRPAGDPAVNQVTWEEMQRIDPMREGR